MTLQFLYTVFLIFFTTISILKSAKILSEPPAGYSRSKRAFLACSVDLAWWRCMAEMGVSQMQQPPAWGLKHRTVLPREYLMHAGRTWYFQHNHSRCNSKFDKRWTLIWWKALSTIYTTFKGWKCISTNEYEHTWGQNPSSNELNEFD